MKIHTARFAVPVALVLQGLVSVAWAQEPAKQPPLDIPKSMAQLDLAKTDAAKPDAGKAMVAAADDKDKPKAVVAKKAKPEAAAAPAKDLVVLAEMGQYKVKAGDTIDRILQKFYASTPLRQDVLREALVQNNPQAFVKGNPKSLLAGANLMLPEPTELVKKLMPVLLADASSPAANPAHAASATPAPAAVAAANAAPHGGAAAHQAGHNPGPDINKRNWVRYP
jgi:Tfp pilus assembly protein FimV